MDGYFQQNGFQRSPSEPSLYVQTQGVDDYHCLALC